MTLRRAAALLSSAFAVLTALGWLLGELVLPRVQSPDATAEGHLVLHGAFAVDAMQVVSAVGSGVALTLLSVAVVVGVGVARRLHAAVLLALCLGGSTALSSVVKTLVDRPRPSVAQIAVSGASFPSGHATESAAVYGAFVVIAVAAVSGRRLRSFVVMAGIAVVLLIGWSRLALGVHYPADVVGGLALGGLWMLACAAATGSRVSLRPSRQASRRGRSARDADGALR